jgi:iron complex outermembrane recepter protein
MEYAFNIAGHSASIRADATYVGKFKIAITDPTPPEDNLAGDYVKLDVSARVSLADVSLDLYVHNLTNEDAFTSRWFPSDNDPYYGMRMRPRTVGMQASYNFGF